MDGVYDPDWERLEVEDPTCDAEDDISYEDNENDAKVDEEASEVVKKSEEEERTDPSVAYANEPPVYHYCSLEAITAVRQRLSTQWEPALCSQLDTLICQMESRQAKSKTLKAEPKERKSIDFTAFSI